MYFLHHSCRYSRPHNYVVLRTCSVYSQKCMLIFGLTDEKEDEGAPCLKNKTLRRTALNFLAEKYRNYNFPQQNNETAYS